jgi:hypothetical protein
LPKRAANAPRKRSTDAGPIRPERRRNSIDDDTLSPETLETRA